MRKLAVSVLLLLASMLPAVAAGVLDYTPPTVTTAVWCSGSTGTVKVTAKNLYSPTNSYEQFKADLYVSGALDGTYTFSQTWNGSYSLTQSLPKTLPCGTPVYSKLWGKRSGVWYWIGQG